MQSRIFSTNNKTGGSNLNSSEIYSQPQIISQPQIHKPKRPTSIARNSSKSKYAESMGKFRKDFIKDSFVNFDYENPKKEKHKVNKEESVSLSNALNFDEEIGVQELHYQMVRLHQNVKKMEYDR